MGIHKMPFFLKFRYQCYKTWGFVKLRTQVLEIKAFYVFLFVVYTKCVLPGDPICKKSENVAPFNTYTLCCVN